MKKISTRLLMISAIVMLSLCREPFEPDFETGVNDYLVVEGFIRVGESAVTEIKLSRVSSLQTNILQREGEAQVQIESSDGTSYTLKETAPGTYTSDPLNLGSQDEYRLRIRQKSGLEYESSFSPALKTPEIDSVSWIKDPFTGISIVVNTHGDDASKFYSWDYVETWELRSDHKTDYRYVNGKVKPRPNAEMSAMRICFKYDYPEDMLVGSTEQLSTNNLRFKLLTFSFYSDRIMHKYSILVNQRVLSEEEYRYLQLIQKNSTNTGSLFDPMPSELRGNIRCTTSPEVQVVGFVGVAQTVSKRIFIYPSEVETPKPSKCESVIVIESAQSNYFETLGYEPLDSLGIIPSIDPLERPVYTGAPRYCVDCRLRGTPERPDYW